MAIQQFSQEFKQILLGSMLGDGCLHIPKHSKTKIRYGNPYYIEAKKIEHLPYLKYKKYILSNHIPIKTFKYSKINDKIYVYLRTQSSKLLMMDYIKLYPKRYGNKIISEEILNKLNWLGIAVWFCDDGFYINQSNTIGFAHHQNYQKKIINYFKNLGFIFLKSGQNHIRLNKKESQKFIEKIKPYILKMPKCMHYKIGDKQKIQNAKLNQKKYLKNYYLKNKIKINKRQMIYYYKNKDWINKKTSQYNKIYRQKPEVKKRIRLWKIDYEKKNRHYISKKCLEYYHKNKEKISAIRIYKRQ